MYTRYVIPEEKELAKPISPKATISGRIKVHWK